MFCPDDLTGVPTWAWWRRVQERQQVWLRLVDDCLVVSTTVAFDRLPDGGNFSGHSYAAKGDSDGCRACGRILLRRAIDCGQKASALSSSGRVQMVRAGRHTSVLPVRGVRCGTPRRSGWHQREGECSGLLTSLTNATRLFDLFRGASRQESTSGVTSCSLKRTCPVDILVFRLTDGGTAALNGLETDSPLLAVKLRMSTFFKFAVSSWSSCAQDRVFTRSRKLTCRS